MQGRDICACGILRFSKWQGTGNDFVLVDDRSGEFPSADLALVSQLCDRHFGIGSDGLILIQKPRQEGSDYHMEFFNPDGSQSFCGNGSRCAYAFWSGPSPENVALRCSRPSMANTRRNGPAIR